MRAAHDLPLGVECAWPLSAKANRRERLWLAVVAVLLLVGGWQAGRGLWIHAKASLAQVLIAQAWSRTLAGESAARPWPWADTWPVARLTVPRLGVEYYVLEGADGSAMAFGPGHARGTALPGSKGNSVIGGHRDTHLAFLREVKPGDAIVIERPDGARLTYRAGRAEVMDRREIWAMEQAGPTRLTLVTCYPFDTLRAGGPLRYVLLAFLS
jgi:sortase A